MLLKIVTQVQSLRPQKATSCIKPRHTTYRPLRLVQLFFCTAHPFTQPPNSYALQCFSIGQTPLKVSLPVGASTPHVLHAPQTHPTHHPTLHLDWFSRFFTAHGIIHYNVHSNTINAQFKKINHLTALTKMSRNILSLIYALAHRFKIPVEHLHYMQIRLRLMLAC